MVNDIIAQEIREIIADQLKFPINQVTDNCDISKDLRADSLDFSELLVSFEERFGIEIEDDNDIYQITVGDVISLIKSKI